MTRARDSRRSGKLRVGVIFGGRSGEHEVSLASAASVLSAIDPTRYEVVPMGIAKDGQWLVGGDPLRALAEAAGVRLALPPASRPANRRRRPRARPGADGRRAARPGRRGAPRRRVPRRPRALRRGRHAPGSPRAGGRRLRRRRRAGLGRRDGQGHDEGRVPGARAPGRPVPRASGTTSGPRSASAVAERVGRRARLPVLREALPTSGRASGISKVPAERGARRGDGDRLRPRPQGPGGARRSSRARSR